MRLRTFTAPDMPTAMRLVREALGDDAIILTSETDKGRGVKITAAVEEEESSPSPWKGEGRGEGLRHPGKNPHPTPLPSRERGKTLPCSSPAADALRFEIQNILRFHNLPELFIAKILQKAPDADMLAAIAVQHAGRSDAQAQVIRNALEKLLGAFFTFLPLKPDSLKHRGIMLVGPPGIGKTLTIAKLATRLALEQRPLAVFTTDTKRAGGVEQLQAFTNILGQPLIIASDSDALRRHVASLPKQTQILIDTAGCNPYGKADIDELRTYAALPGIAPIMALPAGGDSLEAIDMVEMFAATLPIERLLVTHADMARRFGGVLAVAAGQGLSFCNASISSSITDNLQPMTPALLAQFLLQYQLQSG